MRLRERTDEWHNAQRVGVEHVDTSTLVSAQIIRFSTTSANFSSWLDVAVRPEVRDYFPVSTVAEIKEAIARLSPREYCELMAELFPQLDDDWDKQMKADAEAVKLDFIDQDIDKAAREDALIPLDRILAENETGG